MSLHIFGSPVRVGLAIGLAASMLALGPTPASAAGLGPEKRLTKNAARQFQPALSGNRLVYSDWRHFHCATTCDDDEGIVIELFDIRVRNLKTGKDRLLTPKHIATGNPAISGNRVVWNYYRNGRTDAIWYHNLKTGTHKRVPVAGGQNMEISGTRMCYERNDRIYVYNFTTKTEKAVAAGYACDISGNVVIWTDGRNGDGNEDIYSYNLTTKKETRLTTDPANQRYAGISGRHVAWHDDRNWTPGVGHIYDIYSYDLVTGVETPIGAADGYQWDLDLNISGNRIVWLDQRNSGFDTPEVYAFNIATGVETPVSTGNWRNSGPVIDGKRIVYANDRSGGGDLYLRTIP